MRNGLDSLGCADPRDAISGKLISWAFHAAWGREKHILEEKTAQSVSTFRNLDQ